MILLERSLYLFLALAERSEAQSSRWTLSHNWPFSELGMVAYGEW
jgi:hypothetical protein